MDPESLTTSIKAAVTEAMANGISSFISSVREVVTPATESPSFGQKLKVFCKKNWLKLILLILLVGLTSGFGSWLGASFANSSLQVCKAKTDGQHVPY